MSTTTTTTKGKLTPHQREVYNRLVRISRRHVGDDSWRYVWVDETSIGSHGACFKLVAKGWIEYCREYGPRGGLHFKYRPIAEEQS